MCHPDVSISYIIAKFHLNPSNSSCVKVEQTFILTIFPIYNIITITLKLHILSITIITIEFPVGSCEGVRCGGDKRCVLDAELGAHCVRCGACSVAGAPVCAADGRTYAGACALRRAACERGKALPLAYKGSCIGYYRLFEV